MPMAGPVGSRRAYLLTAYSLAIPQWPTLSAETEGVNETEEDVRSRLLIDPEICYLGMGRRLRIVAMKTASIPSDASGLIF